MGIGSKLKQVIDYRDTNVNALANKTGIPKATIYSIINRDNTKVDVDILLKICEALQITTDELLGRQCNDNDNFTDREKIGENILRFRNAIGMSQDELAKKCGYIDRSSIAKIEKGERGLSQSKTIAIAKALGTTPNELLNWKKEMAKTQDLNNHKKQVITTYRKDYLKEKIIATGKNTKAIAAELDIAYSTFRDMLANVGSARFDNVIKLCNYIGISVDELDVSQNNLIDSECEKNTVPEITIQSDERILLEKYRRLSNKAKAKIIERIDVFLEQEQTEDDIPVQRIG